jgi:uncharacterized membrane protein YvbJ
MNCPNCGLANADGARFCANCGTALSGSAPPPGNAYQTQSQYQNPLPPQGTGSPMGRSSTARNIALGCLILVAIFLFFGLSCMRACFGFRRHVYVHRRY